MRAQLLAWAGRRRQGQACRIPPLPPRGASRRLMVARRFLIIIIIISFVAQAWTSTSAWRGPDTALPAAEGPRTRSVSSTRSPRTMPSSGELGSGWSWSVVGQGFKQRHGCGCLPMWDSDGAAMYGRGRADHKMGKRAAAATTSATTWMILQRKQSG